MSKPWVTLDSRETPDGTLELRRRDKGDFLILIGGRVLMNSRASRSEEVLGIRTCRDLQPGARVLVGGPFGFSLHFGPKMKPTLQSCQGSGKILSRFGKTLRRFRKTSPEVFLNLLKVFLNLPKVFLNLPKVFPNLWQDTHLAFSFGAVGVILG